MPTPDEIGLIVSIAVDVFALLVKWDRQSECGNWTDIERTLGKRPGAKLRYPNSLTKAAIAALLETGHIRRENETYFVVPKFAGDSHTQVSVRIREHLLTPALTI